MSDRRRSFVRGLVPIFTAAAVVLVARSSFADHYRVPSGSMEPTVQIDDHICVNKLAYGLRMPATNRYLVLGAQPARGDVVVLTSPRDGTVLLKRVAAVPGDVVEVSEGRVRIDGVDEPVRVEDAGVFEDLDGHSHPVRLDDGGGPDFGPVTVPADRFLVLGDNRGNSADGRIFGWVGRSAILGRAEAVCARGGLPTWKSL
jgi:signal peptidase I